MQNEMNQIKAGQTITGRSIGDHDCIFSAEVISRSKSFAVIKFQGNTKRVKVHTMDNEEFVSPCGQYSMAPVLKNRN